MFNPLHSFASVLDTKYFSSDANLEAVWCMEPIMQMGVINASVLI
jgi:hypothetical protein